jgi:hypothetical protein
VNKPKPFTGSNFLKPFYQKIKMGFTVGTKAGGSIRAIWQLITMLKMGGVTKHPSSMTRP